jgi:replicative DNA helicase
MSLRDRIKDGVSGLYVGLDNGLNRINKYIYGVQRKTIYLYGGLSGAAKTTLVDFKVLKAIANAKELGQSIAVFYYSYEIDELTKKMNWLSTHIYNKYGVAIAPEKIAGLGEHELTIKEQELVDAEIEYIEELFKSIKFRFDPTNPTGIRNELIEYAKENGEFIFESYLDENKVKKQRIVSYKPKNPEEYVIVVMDHLALMKRERDFTLKDNIDKMSEYQVWIRNICGYTFKNIQQFNQGLNSVDRLKVKGADLSPQQADFKDSSNPYQDSDVVLGIMNPHKMDFKEYDGYNLEELEDRFRSLKIIKNRKGRDNVQIGLFFKGQAGTFEELPPAIDFAAGIISYQDYK